MRIIPMITTIIMSSLVTISYGRVLNIDLKNHSVKKTIIRKKHVIVLQPFTDKREDKTLGYTLDSMGKKARKILTSSNVAQ